MRVDSTLSYLFGDHLGTTSLVMTSEGAVAAESRHYAYGDERWSSGTLPTDYRFTDQKLDGYINLYIMEARWYDPYLNRFLSPDSVIPDPGNPQSFNRYSYVYNNPLRFLDSNGHYGREVHEDLTANWVTQATLQLGRSYGMGAKEASALAGNLSELVSQANQGVDCAVCRDASWLPAGELHWMNHRTAADNMESAVQSGDPEAFGRALHAIQDYFSHVGQGFVLPHGAAGQWVYLDLLAQDDFDPSEHGGLSLWTRLLHSRDVGYAGAVLLNNPDVFSWQDEWDQLMVGSPRSGSGSSCASTSSRIMVPSRRKNPVKARPEAPVGMLLKGGDHQTTHE